MAIKASEIKDKDSLKEWLEGQSVDVARVIASRAALRIFPIALSIHQENHPKLTAVIKFDLTLQVFRASFISWVACKYATHDISAAAAAARAADAAAAFAFAADAAAARAADAAYAAYLLLVLLLLLLLLMLMMLLLLLLMLMLMLLMLLMLLLMLLLVLLLLVLLMLLLLMLLFGVMQNGWKIIQMISML